MSNIEISITPKDKDLGDDFIVRRSRPQIKKRMVGPFIFWDHMGPVTLSETNKMKVRAHPHIGLATITYLFSGEIMHRDSLGNEQVIRPGEVNWMTAGSGIVHSERSPEGIKLSTLEGIQLWLALPKEHEKVSPSFIHQKEKDLPLITNSGTTLRLIAGKALDEVSPIPTYSDLFYLSGNSKKDSIFSFDLNQDQEGAIYIISGKVKIEDQEFVRFDMICFKQGTAINFKALEDVSFMIFGGTPFSEGRKMWWNFVASTDELIEQAKLNWKNDKFDKVINEDEYIPLPKF